MARKTKAQAFGLGGEISKIRLKIAQRVHKAAAIFLVAVGVYFLIALFSFHLDDPSWANNYSREQVSNLGGLAGAWIAYSLNFLFGYAAFWVAAVAFISARQLFRDKEKTPPWSHLTHWLGYALALIALCGLLTIHFDGANMPASAGGWIGELGTRGFVNVFGLLGATLLLLALFLGSLHLLADLSWIRIMESVGAAVLDSGGRVQDFMQNLRDKKLGSTSRKQRDISISRYRQSLRQRKKSPPRIEPSVVPPKLSKRAFKEKQVRLFPDQTEAELPALDLLDRDADGKQNFSPRSLDNTARQLEIKLADFGIEAEVVEVQTGPVVARFELSLAPGTKVNRITNLQKDLARALSVSAVRVIEIIPGKSVVGLEIPNEIRETVYLSSLLSSESYDKASSPLTLALGKDATGKPVMVDLQKLPHLLVAGTTGAGKSVAIHAMLMSILFKGTPEQVRLILIDPKMLELNAYDDIPHLLTPVVTDVKLSVHVLRWAVTEMENRYRLMSVVGVRNLDSFNRKITAAKTSGEVLTKPHTQGEETAPLERLPQIVVVIDEFADMMMVVGKKVEELIARLAQKARAAGIHLVIATQRPSVDVITGLIKANIPSRIAFQVSSMVDSRTILDQKGAEQLLGQGDMLYLGPGTGILERVHGAYVSDREVRDVIKFLKKQGSPDYLQNLAREDTELSDSIPGLEPLQDTSDADDPMYEQAVSIVVESRKASISYIQRRLKVGYNRAARMVERMEAAGIVSPVQAGGSRKVLASSPRPD